MMQLPLSSFKLTSFFSRFGAILAISWVVMSAAYSQVTVTADWTLPVTSAPADMFGVNVWSGTNQSIATNPAYIQRLTAMNLGLLRYHSAVTMSGAAGDSANTWIDPVNKVWLTTRIQSILTATKNCAPDKIMNIANFPPWMVDANGKLLASCQGTGSSSYAQFCATLVQIADNNGTYIKYWEPTNELNGLYSGDMPTLSSIFLNCRTAMKAVDSTIQVGGPAFTNPWDNSNYTPFFSAVVGNIDFITYHEYSEGSAKPIATLYSDALGNPASYVAQLAFNAGINVPIFCDEWNMYGSYNQDTSGQMASPQSAVYDALRFKAFIEGGNLAGSTSFNDADNTYGKISSDFSTVRQSGNVSALAHQWMTGCWCQTTSTSATSVTALATRSGTQRAIMLICESSSNQTVNLNFLGLDLVNFPVNTYTISVSTNYTTSSLNYTGTPLNISMAPNSVELLVFNDDVTTGPVFANSSFEAPLTTAWPYYLPNYMTPASINSASSWNFAGNAGIQRNGSGFGANAPAGSQTAFISASGGTAGTISQSVNFTTPGEYRVAFLSARCNTTGVEPVQISVGGANVGAPLSPAGTGFAPSSAIFTIPSAGTYNVTLTSTDLSGSYTTLVDDVKIDQYQNGTPYGGTPQAIPGLVQADNFNSGGEGVAYHDTDPGNDGGSYRNSEAVDLYPTTDSGNGYYVGNINPGEWTKYAVNVATSGAYNINIRASSYWGGGPVVLLMNGVQIASVNVPQTWGTTNFTTLAVPNVQLTVGNYQTLTVQAPNGGFNLNWISFTATGQSLIGHVIALQSLANNLYVTAGANPLIANSSSYGTGQEFKVVDAGNGHVALQALANSLYVCADNGGANPLIANRGSYSTWEEYNVINVGGGVIALQSLTNNLYVCADSGGASPLIANRGSYSSWEEFAVVVVQ